MLDVAVNIIKEALAQNGIEARKFILFGSRARGDYRQDSDWDLLVVIDKAITFPEKRVLTAKIKRKLGECRIPNDVILKSESSFSADKDIIGNISFFAQKEGIEI